MSTAMASLVEIGVVGFPKYSMSLFQAAVVLSLLLLFLVIGTDYIDGWSKRKSLGEIPVIDDGSCLSPRLRWTRSNWNMAEAYEKAYQSYTKRGKPLAVRLPHNGYCVVLPWESSKEWRNLPRDHISFMHVVDVVNGMHYHTAVTDKLPIDAIYKCSNRALYLRQFHATVVNGLDRFLPSTFPIGQANEWYEANTSNAMFDMMAKVAASFIIGPEFATDNDFIQQALSYMFQINATTAAIYSYPRIVRPLAWQFAPACRALRSAIISLKRRLIPEIRARVSQARSGEKDGKFSMLNVLIDTAIEQNVLRRDRGCKEEERAVDQLAQHTMFFFFDAAAPIASVATIMLYRIMTSPEYAQSLREETSEALKASGGEWSFEILSSMPRLESYTREVLRIHVPLVWGPSRQVLKPLTINSLKLTLQPGDLITVPALFTHTDQDLYPDAMEFDPNRFYDSASGKCVPRVTTATDTFLSFGHGTCACPGRTLAMRAVQILFAKMLLLYEVEFADGRKDFPANVLTPGFNLQDPTVMMRVKRRVSSGPANTAML